MALIAAVLALVAVVISGVERAWTMMLLSAAVAALAFGLP